jgi:ribosomal protein S18 acetylase RimI-like enzyme
MWYNVKGKGGDGMLDIRPIREDDRDVYLKMTAEFYRTDAVLLHVGEDHFVSTFAELMRSDDYALCYIFELDGEVAGYSLLAKTYSQEAGGKVLWIEEIYVLPSFRGRGIGRAFFDFLIKSKPKDVKRLRLEVERENDGAVRLYKSFGFDFLDYDQMIIDF